MPMAVLPFGDVGRASGTDRTIKLEQAVGDPDVTVVGVRPGGRNGVGCQRKPGAEVQLGSGTRDPDAEKRHDSRLW